MIDLSELTALYDALGDAVAVGIVADAMGSPAGAEVVAAVEWYLQLPAPNPGLGARLSGGARRLAGRVAQTLGRIRVSPSLVLTLGASVGVYSWMTASERIAVASIDAAYGQSRAVLEACVESGDPECLATMAQAAADGQREASKLAGGGLSPLLVAVVLAAFLFMRK